jgi:hypothetical protein
MSNFDSTPKSLAELLLEIVQGKTQLPVSLCDSRTQSILPLLVAPFFAVVQPAIAQSQSQNTTCYSSRPATNQTLTDSGCSVQLFFEPGIEGALTGAKFQWSDGVTTNATVTTHHWGAWRTNQVFGRALVDGEDADFIDFGNDGGICFIIIENKNQICTRQR